ncbi:PilN family type IVB pilus formation outer membrane protein (plasmid) [Xenorhabdus stockiae]|uniref:PilN family type IVB pilus formation outer membrane protein n=1 Tax=Xenorhabdus stockiae TaxID=351614 RepID=UPI003CF22A0E
MKNKFPLTGVAAALCLLLSGCAPLDRIDKIDGKIISDEKQMDKDLQSAKIGSVVRNLSTQWINPYPINESSGSNTPLPPCSIEINRPGKVTLADISDFINKQCRLSVIVTPDAKAMLTPKSGNKTEQINGPIPAPDPNGMLPLSGMGGNTSSQAGQNASAPYFLHGLFWQGGLGGMLDNVTTRLGVSWRYEKGRITIFYLDTRTFPVNFMDSKAAFNAKTVSGTTSSVGGSGDAGNGGLGGDSNTSQSTEMEIKSSLYEDVTNTIKSMLTPNVGRMHMSAGVLVVTDTPRVLESIGSYLDDRNKQLNRQVVLNVQVYSVEKRKQDQLGIDWKAVLNTSSVGMTLSNTIGAASSALSGGISILDGKGAGSQAFIKALSEQANVSVMTEASSMTTNLSAVPIQVALQQDYASNVTTESTPNVGSSSSVTKSTITTGFNMTVLPFLMPDSSKMQLQFAINMSDDPTMRTFTSEKTSVELMRTRLKTFTQRVIMQSGQTLVLSGYQSLNNTANRQGTGSTRFFGLGGGARGEENKTMLVILITPIILG